MMPPNLAAGCHGDVRRDNWLDRYSGQRTSASWAGTVRLWCARRMLPRSPDTDTFWQAFRRYAGLDHDNYVVGSFGDSPEMATELADLEMAGIKRGTISLARDYGEGREPMPKPGDFRHDARRRTASTVHLANHRGDDQAAISGGRSVRLGRRRGGPHARLVARCPSTLFRPASEP